jgi:hypothetical protein
MTRHQLLKTADNSIRVCLLAAAALLGPVFAGNAQPKPALRPLNLEQTQGDVRVVLLRAGRVTSASNRLDLVVTYAVEVPTNGAFSDLQFSSADEIALVVHGKLVDFHGNASTAAMDFEQLPRAGEVTRPKARPGKVMLAQETVFPGLKIDAEKMEVKLHFTWRGHARCFDFKDVPLN